MYVLSVSRPVSITDRTVFMIRHGVTAIGITTVGLYPTESAYTYTDRRLLETLSSTRHVPGICSYPGKPHPLRGVLSSTSQWLAGFKTPCLSHCDSSCDSGQPIGMSYRFRSLPTGRRSSASGVSDVKENFKVVVRIRPSLDREIKARATKCVSCDNVNQTVTIVKPSERRPASASSSRLLSIDADDFGQRLSIMDKMNSHIFTYDSVFDPGLVGSRNFLERIGDEFKI